MFPSFELFGLTVPTYYLIESIDVVIFVVIVALLLALKFKLRLKTVVQIIIICIPLSFVNLFLVGYLEEMIRTGEAYIGEQDYFGFLIMIVPLTLIASKLCKVSEKTIFSAIVPACAFSAAFIKIGCLSVGCAFCRGIETDGFGIRYPGENFNRVPIEIYELIFGVLLFCLLLFIVMRSRKPTFWPFLIFFITFPIYRFIQDFFRQIPEYFLGLNYSQVNAIILLVIVLAAALYLLHKERKEEATSLESFSETDNSH